MTTPERAANPDLPTEKGLDNALRNLHGEFYIRQVESATERWLVLQGKSDDYRHDAILFHADVLGGMLAYRPGEVEASDEWEYSAQFIAAREGVLAGLMAGEQWLGRDMDMAEVLNKMVATGVTLWEKRPEYRPHIAAALLQRAVEGLDLLTPAQLRKVKVWERDIAKKNEVPQSGLFSLGVGVGLIESKRHLEYWRGSLVADQQLQGMGEPQSILDLDSLNSQFSGRSSVGGEAISD
jgi:hypothetical protein